MASDGLQVVLEVHFVQSANEQHWVVVQSSDSHLQTHGPQLTRFHPPHQTLNHCLHKQRDALWEVNSHSTVNISTFRIKPDISTRPRAGLWDKAYLTWSMHLPLHCRMMTSKSLAAWHSASSPVSMVNTYNRSKVMIIDLLRFSRNTGITESRFTFFFILWPRYL